MLKDLTKEQLELAQYMSDLSEEPYCAGWMLELEYALWQVATGGRDSYGCLAITEEHVDRLRRLSAACNGWTIFDDQHEETWVSLSDWENRFSIRQLSSQAKQR